MGVAARYFLVNASGNLQRIPASWWYRAMREEETLPEHRAQDLKVLEIVVETERRTVTAVLRVLPFRMVVRDDGRLDVRRHGRLAMQRFSHAFTTAQGPRDPIAELELDANYFWEPEETHWRQLSETLELPVTAIRRRLYRRPRT